MLDPNIVVAVAGLLAIFSSLPVASAKKVCTETSAGEEVCRDTLPTPAKVAIAVVTLAVVFLSLTLCLCVRRNRKASDDAAKECSVEASQMEGPATVLRATYNPGSGHSLYAIGTPESGEIATAVIPPTRERTPAVTPAQAATPPAFPTPSVPAAPYSPSPRGGMQPMTAPAHRSTFSNSHQPYHFTGTGNMPGSPQAPRSAFVSSGPFPRPLLAGRLKDRIRERPPSVSSLTYEPSTPNK